MRSTFVPLSAEDLDRIQRAQLTLLSPFGHDDVDSWRAACIRTVQRAVGARAGLFVLPGTGAPRFFSEDYEQGEADEYPVRMEEVLPDVWATQVELGVHTEQDVWASVLDTLYESAYFHEVRVPHGALNAGGLTTLLSGTPSPHRCAQLLTHRGPGADPQGDRERAIYRLLFPAFVSGCAAALDMAGAPATLLRTLDALESPTLLGDLGGRALHRNTALRDLLAKDASGRLEVEIDLFLSKLSRGAVGATLDVPWIEVVRADGLCCRIRASLFDAAGIAPRTLVLITVEPAPRLPEAPGPWVAPLGLTQRQAQVAVLLARGWSNKRIAEALGVRPKTARRHTEAVLRTLRVGSRAAVASKLLSVS